MEKTVLFDSEMAPYQVLPLQGSVDLGAMAMKVYSTFPKSPRLEPCHIHDTRWVGWWALPLGSDAVGIFYSPQYLSLPPTRHDLTQGQKPEGRLKWG